MFFESGYAQPRSLRIGKTHRRTHRFWWRSSSAVGHPFPSEPAATRTLTAALGRTPISPRAPPSRWSMQCGTATYTRPDPHRHHQEAVRRDAVSSNPERTEISWTRTRPLIPLSKWVLVRACKSSRPSGELIGRQGLQLEVSEKRGRRGHCADPSGARHVRRRSLDGLCNARTSQSSRRFSAVQLQSLRWLALLLPCAWRHFAENSLGYFDKSNSTKTETSTLGR